MDVSSVTQAGPTASSVVKTGGTTKTSADGNRLPDAKLGGVVSGLVPQQAELASSSQPDPKELSNLVAQANVTMQGRFSDLKFTVAEGTDIAVVRIEDAKTGELIRQVPSEAMVAIARALDEFQRGIVLEEKA